MLTLTRPITSERREPVFVLSHLKKNPCLALTQAPLYRSACYPPRPLSSPPESDPAPVAPRRLRHQCQHGRYLLRGMLVHLDDPSFEIQSAVQMVLEVSVYLRRASMRFAMSFDAVQGWPSVVWHFR